MMEFLGSMSVAMGIGCLWISEFKKVTSALTHDGHEEQIMGCFSIVP